MVSAFLMQSTLFNAQLNSIRLNCGIIFNVLSHLKEESDTANFYDYGVKSKNSIRGSQGSTKHTPKEAGN